METCNRALLWNRGKGTRSEYWPLDEALEVRRDGRGVPVPARSRVLRVLVGDGNRDSANSMAILVRMWGHAVRVAYTGTTALQAVWDQKSDVLLLEVAMPEIDGFRLARAVRQHPRFQGSLLVAVTGYADDDHRRRGQEEGFDHYFAKPADPAAVQRLLWREKARLDTSPEARRESQE